MTTNRISTKIKTIGALLVILMLTVIIATIYLNQKNSKGSLTVNVAGKERMLTQKISKNIFYLYNNQSIDFSELDNAVAEFIYNMDSLKNGNRLRGISAVPTEALANQISNILVLWESFYTNVKDFKELLVLQNQGSEKLLKSKVLAIYKTNNILLEEVDKLVSMYTVYYEAKTDYIKKFQYGSTIALLLLIIYSLTQLKVIESHAQEFLKKSKMIVQSSGQEPIEPIKIEAESEIVEATDTLNCFIDKINSAMGYSHEAILQSKNAATRLEEITDGFSEVLLELKDSAKINSHLNRSEDIVIESTEELINSTKKLQNLKDELDKLIISCKTTQ